MNPGGDPVAISSRDDQPNPRPGDPRRRTGKVGWPAACLGIVLIFASLAAFVFHRLETAPGRALAAGSAELDKWAARVRDGFVSVAHMQPRVTVDERVVFQQTSPILELAVVEREMSVERDTEDTWLGSTKRLRVRGSFRVRAGFDLTRPVSLRIESGEARLVRVWMPPPKVLGVELTRLEVLAQDNGLWNRVQPEDFQNEVNALNLDAHLKAQQDGLPREAARLFKGELQERLGAGAEVEISTGLAPASATPRP